LSILISKTTKPGETDMAQRDIAGAEDAGAHESTETAQGGRYSIPNPYLDFLGIRVVALESCRAELELVVVPVHLNRSGGLHGGLAATLLDAACGCAGMHVEGEARLADVVTLSLTVNYQDAFDGGAVCAVGRVGGGGRQIYFSEGRLSTPGGHLIATCVGTSKRRQGSAT
jgi:uncharacterized protein (TIGR00369 family)